MDKEKEIEEMAKVIMDSAFNDMSNKRSLHKFGVSGFYAEALISAGYGNVKQAIKDFAGKLFENISVFLAKKNITSANEVKQIIRKTEELYGEDKNES